ncbi:flagellar M-ring protein FliF, partial [bacterium]|nr:flagellar M-ring protein FliF [bacterium]
MRQLLENLKTITGRFTFNQKILMVVILGAAVLSVAIFSVWLRNEEKTVLFTNLSPEDASMAIAELNKQNVEAELTNGGTTIMVPEGVVHRLRVDLTAKGIPSSGTVGWGIFDGKQYGMTEFVQNVNFKRALEGELTKTIESINGIRAARVHLVMPKPSIFKKMQSPATASVVLTLGSGSALSAHQIRGVQSLVAGSVEGLEIPNVSVHDQYGVVLSENFDNEGAARSEGQLALKKEVDAYLADKAQGMLAHVLGQNRSIVRVDATLNFERLEQQRKIFDPAQTVVRSEERNESTEGEGGSNEQSTTNYEINETMETVVGEIGGVKTMSVAVFVDGRYEPAEQGGA